jgi:hypothetical protein
VARKMCCTKRVDGCFDIENRRTGRQKAEVGHFSDYPYVVTLHTRRIKDCERKTGFVESMQSRAEPTGTRRFKPFNPDPMR